MSWVAERVILVNGLPGSGKTTLARRLGAALGVPVVSKDAVKEALLTAVPAWRRCGEPVLVEVWCDVPAEVARSRCANRVRHPMYEDARHLATSWGDWARRAEPLAIGAVVRADTSADVDVAAIVPKLTG
jgi:predicted kinase